MTSDFDPQIETEITAYINGQLDGERRYAVAAYLASRPQRAAEVMAQVQLTEGLRMALGTGGAPLPPPLQSAATKLQFGLKSQQRLRDWLPVAAAAAMFALGWGAQSLFAPQGAGLGGAGLGGAGQGQSAMLSYSAHLAAYSPSLLDAALDAQDAIALRKSLEAELGPMPRDAVQIAQKLGIALPDLPQGWVILAAQVVATPERPGVALVIATPNMGEILLFSVVRNVDGPDTAADTAMQGGRALAFFENERTAYVLVDAAGPATDLRKGAEELRLRLSEG